MAHRFDTWESYFYPVPDDRTLRNLFDERDPDVLARLESVEAAERQRELMAGEVAITRPYDADHLRTIHQHLFQDVYPWAGEYRTVEIAKGVGRSFAEAKTGEIDRYLSDVKHLVDETEWPGLDREAFAERAAAVFAYLNQAHPFREGNGRTAKVFMEQVAEQSRFTFDYGRVSPHVWNQASMLSRPDLFAYEPQPASLVPVFAHITIERSQAHAAAPGGVSRERSPLSASFPRPAAAATRPGTTLSEEGPRTTRPYMPGRGRSDSTRGRER